MGERIVTMLRKEFRSVLRDPRMRMVIFGLPIIHARWPQPFKNTQKMRQAFLLLAFSILVFYFPVLSYEELLLP